MRAFMSQSDDRRTKEIDADQLGFASAFQWGEMAEREARRILAETEPREPGETKHCRAVDVRYWQRNARHNVETRSLFGPQIAAHRALADALRAFVEGV